MSFKIHTPTMCLRLAVDATLSMVRTAVGSSAGVFTYHDGQDRCIVHSDDTLRGAIAWAASKDGYVTQNYFWRILD